MPCSCFGGVLVGLLWTNSCCAPCITPRCPRARYHPFPLPLPSMVQMLNELIWFVVYGMTQSWAAGADRSTGGMTDMRAAASYFTLLPVD